MPEVVTVVTLPSIVEIRSDSESLVANIPVCSLCLMSRRDSIMGRRILKNNLLLNTVSLFYII